MDARDERAYRQMILSHDCDKNWPKHDWLQHNLAAEARIKLLWWWRVCASFGVYFIPRWYENPAR